MQLYQKCLLVGNYLVAININDKPNIIYFSSIV